MIKRKPLPSQMLRGSCPQSTRIWSMFISRDFASTELLLLSPPSKPQGRVFCKGEDRIPKLGPFGPPWGRCNLFHAHLNHIHIHNAVPLLCLRSHAWFSSFCELVCKILGVQHPLIFYRLILVLQTLYKREPASKHVREGCEMPCSEEE